jgi:hypothetical protein
MAEVQFQARRGDFPYFTAPRPALVSSNPLISLEAGVVSPRVKQLEPEDVFIFR